MLTVRRVVSEPLSANVWVVASGGEAMVVDSGTGADAAEVVARIRRALDGATVRRVHLTHVHCDHCGGARALHDALGCPVTMHEAEAPAVRAGDARATLGTFLGLPQAPCPVEGVREGDRLPVGGVEFEVLTVPGHTGAHTALWEPRTGTLFAGDVAFPGGSFGRVDFPGGDPPALLASLERLARLRPEALYPGHMEAVEKNAVKSVEESLANARLMLEDA